MLEVESDGGVERFETYCDCRSEPAEAVLNVRQLIAVLDAIEGEAVDLELNGPGIPSVVHASGLRYCMMPLGGETPASAAVVEEQDVSDEITEDEGQMVDVDLPDAVA